MGVKKFSTPVKLLLFFSIFVGLCAYDVNKYLQERPQNLFEILEVPRTASSVELNEACDRYITKFRETQTQISEEFLDSSALLKFMLNPMQVEDARTTLVSDDLRDTYEKIGHITPAAEYSERKGTTPQAVRYMQAVGASMQLAGFFLLVLIFIEKHQVFAKQVSMTSLLIAIYVSVYMRFPRENDKDNELAALLDSLPFLQNLTIHEKANLLVATFGNLFQFIMSLSRLIDGNPEEDVKLKYKKFQKKSFNTQLLCELMHPMRVSVPAVQPPADPTAEVKPDEQPLV